MLPNKDEVISSYKKFCDLSNQTGQTISIETEEFLYPTTLLPLKIHCLNTQKEIVLPKNPAKARYCRLFMGDRTYPRTSQSSYLSVTKLPIHQSKSDETFRQIIDVCERGKNMGGRDPLSYYINELLNNIYEHSGFTQAYAAVQGYRTKGFVEIVIVDNGISIPGKYVSTGITAENDVEYLKLALQGVSTKERERGFGLHTSLKVVVELIGGQFFLFSRNAGLAVDNHEQKLLILDNQHGFPGTLICI